MQVAFVICILAKFHIIFFFKCLPGNCVRNLLGFYFETPKNLCSVTVYPAESAWQCFFQRQVSLAVEDAGLR